MFNKEFRESEERELRPKKEEPAMLSSSEAPFVQAVTQTSLALTASLDMTEPEVGATHQAVVFEKLMAPEGPEEEIPTTIGEGRRSGNGPRITSGSRASPR